MMGIRLSSTFGDIDTGKHSRRHACIRCLVRQNYVKKGSRKCLTNPLKVPSSRRDRRQWDRNVVPESRTTVVTFENDNTGREIGIYFGQNALDGLPHPVRVYTYQSEKKYSSRKQKSDKKAGA